MREVGDFGRQREKLKGFGLGIFLGGVALGFSGICLGVFVSSCFFKGSQWNVTEQGIKLQMGPRNGMQTSAVVNVKEFRWAQRIYEYSRPMPTQTVITAPSSQFFLLHPN